MKNLALSTGISGGTAIKIANSIDPLIEDVLITGASASTGFNTGIVITGDGSSTYSVSPHITRVRVTQYRGTGITIDHTTDAYVDSTSVWSPADNTDRLGIVIDTGVGGFYGKSISQLYGLHGLVVQNTNLGGTYAGTPAWLFCDQCIFDTTTGGSAVVFDSTLSNNLVSAFFTDSWTAGAGQNSLSVPITASANGIEINGGKGYNFSGMRIRNNTKNGIYINSSNVSTVNISSSFITTNNSSNNADGHGIYINSSSSGISIIGNTIGNVLEASGHQKYGVKISAVNADQLRIENNDLGSNETGAFLNGNTGVYTSIGNLPSANAVNSVLWGKLGIGTTTPNYTLDVGNNTTSGIVSRFVNSTGTCDINPTATALSCSSDMTLKKNITTIADNKAFILQTIPSLTTASTLDKMTTLSPVMYNWNSEKDTDPKHTGFIAQEVEQVFPDLVSTDPITHLKSLNYMGLIPYSIQSIKDLNLTLTSLTTSDIASLPPDSFAATFWKNLFVQIGKYLADAGNGVGSIMANAFHAKDKICVDDQCLGKDDVRILLQLEHASVGNTAPVTTPSNSSPDSSAVPAPDTTTSDTIPTVIPVSTPDTPSVSL